MKDYLIENQPLLTQRNYFALVNKVEKNTQEIEAIQESMVTKTELSDIMDIEDYKVTIKTMMGNQALVLR